MKVGVLASLVASSKSGKIKTVKSAGHAWTSYRFIDPTDEWRIYWALPTSFVDLQKAFQNLQFKGYVIIYRNRRVKTLRFGTLYSHLYRIYLSADSKAICFVLSFRYILFLSARVSIRSCLPSLLIALPTSSGREILFFSLCSTPR